MSPRPPGWCPSHCPTTVAARFSECVAVRADGIRAMLRLGPGNPGCQQLNTTDPVNGICELAIFLDSFVALPVSLTRKVSLLQPIPLADVKGLSLDVRTVTKSAAVLKVMRPWWSVVFGLLG